jgi:Rrf2 family protein
MAHLACRGSAWVSAREISEHSRVPLPVLMNILNALAHCGLVTSTRGAKGGYRLARPPDEITLVDLIEAIDGPIKLTVCAPAVRSDFEARCRLEGVCLIREPARRVHRSLEQFLCRVTLAQLVSEVGPATPVAPTPVEPALVGAGR